METEGIEEEAIEILNTSLEVEVEEEGEEEGDFTLRELGDIEFMNQEVEPSGTTLVVTPNGFKELSRLTMLWNVRHCWSAGARFAFN